MNKPRKISKEEWMEYCDNLTDGQNVGAVDALINAANPYIFNPKREGWDLRWEIDRLGKMLESKDKEIGSLRFDIAVLKAELNAIRGGQNG